MIITEDLPSLDAAWFDYTLLKIDSDIPENQDLFRLRSAKQVNFNGRTFDFDLKHRKNWRVCTKLRLTPGQIRWTNELKFPLLKVFKVLRRIAAPQNIKLWFFDSLHIALPVLYKEEKCWVCGQVIRSSHFHNDCSGLKSTKDKILKINPQSRNVCAAYINFRRHCLFKHRDEKSGAKWIKILDTVRSSLLYECDMKVEFTNDLEFICNLFLCFCCNWVFFFMYSIFSSSFL